MFFKISEGRAFFLFLNVAKKVGFRGRRIGQKGAVFICIRATALFIIGYQKIFNTFFGKSIDISAEI